MVISWSIASIAGGQMGNVVPFGNPIGPKVIKWFQNRGISEKTLINYGVYSKPHLPSGGEVIKFPYILGDKVLNEKTRTAQKEFYLVTGGELIFWNANVLLHPDLQSGKQSLVITEGEIDALSFIEAGYPYVVSVPNGAKPPPEDDKVNGEEDPELKYVKKSWKDLINIKRIILATDTDGPGQYLKLCLALNLGEARCYVASYPTDCKDANDVLASYGPERVQLLVSEATPYPITCLYKASTLPPEPVADPLTTGWGRLDPFLMLYISAFMVVTGKPTEGKTIWTTQLAANMAINHGWKVAIASFEGLIQKMISQLRAVHAELNPNGDVDQWLDDHFNFILPRSDSEYEDRFDLDWLINKAVAIWVREGINMLILDPWNELEHSWGKNENQTDYVGSAIRRLKKFAREKGVLVLVVAHPTKGACDKKASDDIELWDIADSAHWYNKADIGVVIARIAGSNETNVHIRKVKHEGKYGQKGKVPLTFDPYYGIFSQ